MSDGKAGQSCRKNGKYASCSVNAAMDFLLRKYPSKTARNFHADTGISEETFRNWCAGKSKPQWDHTVTMIAVYGLPFLAAVFGADGDSDIARAARAAERDALKAQIDEMTKKYAALAGE